MMNSKELRIGNYLGGRNGIVTVSAIQEDGTVWLKEGGKNFIVESDKPCLLPIPLTEEWLVKFGFELDKEDFFVKISKGGDVLLMECLDGSWCASVPHLEFVSTFGNKEEPTKVAESRVSTTMVNNNGGFDSVNQLQNLYFALTNEELTYEQ